MFSQKKSTRRTGVDAEELSGEEVDAAELCGEEVDAAELCSEEVDAADVDVDSSNWL